MKRAESRTEWYKSHYSKLAQKYKCHPEMIQYMSAKYHFQGFSQENLITHCETRFVQYPVPFSHKRYFYLAVATFLKTLKPRQFYAIVNQPKLPNYLVDVKKVETPHLGDLAKQNLTPNQYKRALELDGWKKA